MTLGILEGKIAVEIGAGAAVGIGVNGGAKVGHSAA